MKDELRRFPGLRSSRMVVCLWLTIVVLCYFAYPAWKNLGETRPWSFSLAARHLVVLIGLSIWWLRTDGSTARVEPRWSWRQFGTKAGVLMLLSLGGLAAGQWIMMGWPITSGNDEPTQVRMHLIEFRALTGSETGLEVILFLAAAIGLVILGSILFWLVPGRREGSRAGTGTARMLWPVLAIALGMGALLFASYFFQDRIPHQWGVGVRWPPVGTLATVASHALLGPTEVGARLPALLFFLLTGVYIYRIVAGETDRWLAVAAAIFCLSMPIFFALGHRALRESGGAFFLTAGLFYLLRHMRDGNAYDIGMVGLSTVLGYLERRPVAVLLFIVGISLIAVRFLASQPHRLRKGWPAVRLYGGAAVLSVWAVLPWVKVTIERDVRPFRVHLANWSNPEIVTGYLRSWPETIGWPATFLVVAGAVVALIRRRHVDWVGLACLTLVYALFTSDDPRWIPHDRFVVLMCPAVALLSIGVFGAVKRWGRVGSISAASIVVLVGLCPLIGWLRSEPFAYTRPATAKGLSAQKYYPFDQLVDSLSAEGITQGTFAPPLYWQTSLRAYLLMRDKSDVREKIPAWSAGPRKRTLEQVRMLCVLEEIDYIVVPRVHGRPKFFTDLTAEQIERDDIDGFSVVGSHVRGEYGLTLLRADPPGNGPEPPS